MKKTIAITSALAAVSSLATAEIKINDFLSFEGFVDMSYTHADRDFNPGSASDNSFRIDQVEIDWLFNFDNVTARVDLEYEDPNGTESGTAVEQAFVNYDLGSGASLTVGRYETMLGLEAKEPTGLYQYSTAYSSVIGAIDGPFNEYAQGVKYSVQSDDLSYAISIQDEAFGTAANKFGGQSAGGSYAIEAAASLTSGAITYFLGGAWEDGDQAGDTWLANAHVTYQDGPLTLGAEGFLGNSSEGNVTFGSTGGGNDIDVQGGLIMANYAYSDCCSVTGRIGYVDYENSAGGQEDQLKYTLAHNYAVTDNLAVITEVSLSEYETSGGADEDELLGAVEVLFTF